MEKKLADSLDVLKFPKEVYTIIMEFAILYLQQTPQNLAEFGTQFFEKKYQESSGIGTSFQLERPSIASNQVARISSTGTANNQKTNEEIEKGKALLSNVGIFKYLIPQEIQTLAEKLLRLDKKNGEKIFQEETDIRGIYLVESGKVKLITTKPTSPKQAVNSVKTILEKGDHTDVLSLICYKPTEFSAYAIDEVSVFYLSVDSFESVVGSCSFFLHRAYDQKGWEKYIQGNPYMYILRYELRNFIICYLIQKPPNFLIFGMIYFNEMSKNPGQIGFLNMGKIENQINSTNRVVNVAMTSFPTHPKTEEEERLLRDSISNILIFKSLGKDQVDTIISALEKKEFKAGQTVIRQGEENDFFYIIQSGRCKAYVTNDGSSRTLKMYHRSASFGEMNLIYENKSKYPNSITALTESSLWALPRNIYKRVIRNSFLEGVIGKVPMLKSLKPKEKKEIVKALVPKKYKHGEAIMKENEIGDGMYFVTSGEVIIKKLIKGVKTTQAKIKKGGHFGETALMTKLRRTTSAYAVGDVEVAFLDISTFEHLLGPNKEMLMKHIDMYEKQIMSIMAKIGTDI